MANYETTKIQSNEVVKADDFEFGFEAQIDNISRAFQGVFEPNQNFVIGGRITPYYQGGMNVSIAPIFGVCASTEKSFIDTNKIEPISISQAGNDLRIDIIQVRATVEDYDEQQRSFSDFETGVNELRYVFTRQRYKVETNVKIGIPGAVTAPTVDEGWVKLAEIVIPVGTTEITESNIKNITSDIAGLENSEWTNEKTSTYNMGYISDVNRRFRHQHNEDGTHKARIIGENQLNIGISSGQVSGNVLPIGKQIPVNETSNAATTNISDIVLVLASKITDLFNSYLKYGAFNFKGELVIGNIIDDNAIVSPLKIGADGDGTAYLKIGNRNILTITVTGQIRMADGYTATASTDLVTKAVTDSLSANLTNLTNRVDNIVANLDSTVYTNNLYSRYSVYTEQTIAVATTTNIETLSGLKTIDGINLTQGQYVLVKNQTNEIENGIYLVSENNWSRDIFATAESLKYKFFIPTSGNQNKNKLFYIPIEDFTLGTNNIFFKKAIFDLGTTKYTVPLRNSSGQLDVGSNAIKSGNIANGAVTIDKIEKPIPTEKIENNAVTIDKLSNDLQNLLLPAGKIEYLSFVPTTEYLTANRRLICDGSEVLRSEYPRLFNAIGTTFGVGDGTTTFNLPNYIGKMLFGSNSTVTETGGNAAVTLISANLPSHTHSMSHTHTINHTHGSVLTDNPRICAWTGESGTPSLNDRTSSNYKISLDSRSCSIPPYTGNSGSSSASSTGSTGSGSSFSIMNPYNTAVPVIIF